MLYCVNMSRNVFRKNCCKEITDNSQNIAWPHGEVMISVVNGPVSQPSSIGAPLEIFKCTLSRGVAFQFSISSPSFLPLVRFCAEEQNFGNPRMCSISYFVIKRCSANHLWRLISNAARKKSAFSKLSPIIPPPQARKPCKHRRKRSSYF